MTRITKPFNIVCIIYSAFVLFSCRTTDMENNVSKGTALIKVNLQGTEFKDTGELATRTSANKKIYLRGVQQQEIQLGSGITLHASLEAMPGKKLAQASQGKNYLAVTTENVKPGIKYRVAVYKNNGDYFTQRLYTRGSENTTEALMLDGGSTYIFVVYSFNTAIDPGVVPSINIDNPIVFNGLTSTSDLMYYRTSFQVSGNRDNILNVLFQHRLSQVTVTLNSSRLKAGNIGRIASNFSPHFTRISIDKFGNLSSGMSGESSVIFNDNPGEIRTANPTIISTTGGLNTKYTISSITIGTENRQNLILDELEINPGFRYNLDITFKEKPVSGPCTVEVNMSGGIKKKFMCYNLGASVTTTTADYNPNQPIVPGLHGGKYVVWGRDSFNLSEKDDQDKDYYLGTSLSTTKPRITWPTLIGTTIKDPCPDGFRIPTEAEWNEVFSNNTMVSMGGVWSDEQNAFNRAVKLDNLILPAGGSRSPTGNPPSGPGRLMNGRGYAMYWAADYPGSSFGRVLMITNSNGSSTSAVKKFETIASLTGVSVRCIKN
ncbi:hypothetical protein [Elizabethkingia meningoseptica]|uniref:hypothetical protein n=1 Tax=Elizabethkingia meningoseptica TaxID=238 RepID=UPI003891EAFA